MRTKHFFIFLLLFPLGISKAQETTEGAPIVIRVSSKYLSPGQEYTLSGQTLTGNRSLSVTIEILSGTSVKETETVQTDTFGKYQLTRKAPSEKGIYLARATGADGKLSNVATFAVVNMSWMGEALAEQFDKPILLAQKGLDAAEMIVSALPPSNAKKEFKERYKDVYTKFSEVNEKMGTLKSSFVRLMKVAEQAPAVKEETEKCVDELDAQFEEMRKVTERFSWEVSQKSQDKVSVCEQIDLVLQALKYASFITNIASSISETIMNFAKSEAISGAIEYVTPNEDLQFAAGITVNAALAVSDPVGMVLGALLELTSYCTEQLYKIYCAEMKGPFTGKFYAEFEAGNGEGIWEKYSMGMKGELTLRYGRGGNPKSGFAVSGEFEGFFHDYQFWADVTKVEQLPRNMFLVDQIIINPVSGYFMDKKENLDRKFEEEGYKRKTVSLGPAAFLVPGNFHIKVKGVVKGYKLLLKFDDKSAINKITNLNEDFKMVMIAANPVVPVPLIKTFHFPVAPARSVFIVGMKGGIEFDLQRTDDQIDVRKRIDQKRSISNDEIRLRTQLDVSITTNDNKPIAK